MDLSASLGQIVQHVRQARQNKKKAARRGRRNGPRNAAQQTDETEIAPPQQEPVPLKKNAAFWFAIIALVLGLAFGIWGIVKKKKQTGSLSASETAETFLGQDLNNDGIVGVETPGGPALEAMLQTVGSAV